MIEAIKDALLKLPEAKEIWLNHNDYKGNEDEMKSLGLVIKENAMVQMGLFYLSEKTSEDILDHLKRDIFHD